MPPTDRTHANRFSAGKPFEPPGRRAAGPPGCRAAGLPGRRAAGPPGCRAAEPPCPGQRAAACPGPACRLSRAASPELGQGRSEDDHADGPEG
ncbi:hypothetical protein F6X54_08825 [Micromonospora aurantiaca]|uniref:Uncharacterized protein n=1 Tax=Micromonospora aurantiaca (nom. illeg.) TaxID=47850 RepID=A0ABQ6UJQ8_9ACTN|nr:hypothetical protein F6X54_08825 [Micromonospora aurantiaca]